MADNNAQQRRPGGSDANLISRWQRLFAQHNGEAIVLEVPPRNDASANPQQTFLITSLSEAQAAAREEKKVTESVPSILEEMHRDRVKHLRHITKELDQTQWMFD